MSGLEELYGDASEATPTPEAQPAPAPEAAPPVEPAATPEAPVVEATPVVETPPVAAPQSEPQSERDRDIAGLIRALQDERDQKKAAREEAARLKAWRDEQERKRQEQAAEVPDMLADPDGYHAWSERRYEERVRREVAQADARNAQALQALSRNMMMRHLGAEKFGELDKFIQAAPDQAHAIALKQPDPYGWFFEKYEQAQAHRKSQEALKQLDGRSIEDIVAERVAAALAAKAAEAPAEPAKPQPARNADGTFAPSQPEQRHRPKSLSEMNGAAVVAPAAPGSALDELYG